MMNREKMNDVVWIHSVGVLMIGVHSSGGRGSPPTKPIITSLLIVNTEPITNSYKVHNLKL